MTLERALEVASQLLDANADPTNTLYRVLGDARGIYARAIKKLINTATYTKETDT